MIRKTWFALAASAAVLSGCQDRDGAAGGNVTAKGDAAQHAPSGTIAQFAAGNADYSRFNDAIKAAGLEATMAGAGPYTVFAPNNAAFARIPAETGTAMMSPAGKSRLIGLLTNHVVPGVVTADDLAKAIERGKGKAVLATLGTGKLNFSKNGDAIIVTDDAGATSRIVQADAMQSNGIVHGLDTVLMPKA
jgi:uncharacterized surface protein with fasciclin (FAS1) repeats